MPMKRIIFLILFLSPITFFGQQQCQMKLYLNDMTPLDNASGIVIKRIEKNRGINNYVTVTLQDGTKVKYPKKDVWGYQLSNANGCRAYRLHKGFFYKIKQENDIIIYTRRSDRSLGETVINQYFGTSLTGSVYGFSKKNLKKAYSNNECVMNRIEGLDWNYRLSYYNDKTETYRLEDIIKACQ